MTKTMVMVIVVTANLSPQSSLYKREEIQLCSPNGLSHILPPDMSLWREDFWSYCVLIRPLVDDHLCCCCLCSWVVGRTDSFRSSPDCTHSCCAQPHGLNSRHCWFSHSSDPQSSPGSSASLELTSLRSLRARELNKFTW